MKKHYQKIPFCILAACMFFVILTSGCTYNGPNPLENTPATPTNSVTAETTQSVQSGSTQPTVSWKDFYPDHTEQEKSQLIEKAKDEILRVFPTVDRSTLNGEWVEHARTNGAGTEMIGSPYIDFENLEFSSGENREFVIEVDPESMKVIYYSPYKGTYSSAKITYGEGKEKAVEFIKKAQGGDSIADDPDAYTVMKNEYASGGRPMASVSYYKKFNGVPYESNRVSAEYDLSRDKVERYFDYTANPGLLSGLTTLSPEPDITLEEAKQIFENKISGKYDLDELELEYSETSSFDTYLLWWDDDNIVYADDPNPIPLVWFITCSDKDSREEYEETGVSPESGAFIIDAHTGEIYWLKYGEISIKKYLS
ncbi:hypothetical protein [Methanolacinia paynteri]|uniref:hypothetical protein n=1 Tax=Methanolacinia paynteri TaxID=230356 RepID=UPI00064E53E8|nr:hypothetical protein [Methanolacinia paynteri]